MSLELATRILHVKDGSSYDTIDILRGPKGDGSDIDVDDALSPSSENPVQNKVVTGAVNDLVMVSEQQPSSGNNKLWIEEDGTYVDLPTVGELNDVGSNIASAYDNSATYAVGEYCLHDRIAYRCTTAISTPEAWNSAQWTRAVIGDEITELSEDITELPSVEDSDATGVDLDVSDEDGNVLVRFKDGYIKTKNFDSENPDIGIKSSNREGADLDLSDPNGNIIARFKSGNFITKNFNSETFADVKAFGAIGDGTTDDTEALEAAMEFGFENKTAVRFTEGTYLIRRPLTLRSNMEILGEGNAVIKTKASTTTTLVAALAENSETMVVASVAGFEVGDAIGISYTSTDLVAARHCSVGTITAINSANNTITFKSAYDSIKKGAVRTHEVGCYVSNCCAIFRSYGMLYACDNVYIHGLTLDGNRQNNEWSDWFAGAIHIDAGAGSGTVEGIPYIYSQTNPIFRDLVIKNAHFDGISDQGGGGATITNCIIQNPSMHGVHFGTTYVHATVSDCIIENTQGGAAVFWCADASEIAVIGNKIRNCYKGCSDKEYANAAQKSVIIGNIFENITSYVFDFSATVSSIVGSITIVGNVIIGVKATIANIIHRGRIVFSNNIIDSFTIEPSVLFACDQSERLSIIGNIAPVFSGTVMSGTYTDVVNQLNSWD